MSKLLRLKDCIVLGLAAVGDFSEDVRLMGDLVPEIMEMRYGFIPPNFKKKSYFASVCRLLKTGEISKNIDESGNVLLVLTSVGEKRLKRKFPIFAKNKWDGSFMIVVFDIPEKEKKARQILRNKLKELGFGMMQESVWISPYHFEEDLKEFLDIKGYLNYVFVLKAQKLIGENIGQLVNKIWNLDEIESRYRRILSGEFGVEDAWRQYFSILSDDPLLPKDLLADNWPRGKVIEYLKNLVLTKNMRSRKKLQS